MKNYVKFFQEYLNNIYENKKEIEMEIKKSKISIFYTRNTYNSNYR